MNNGSAALGCGAVILIAFVALLAIPALEMVTQAPAGDYVIAPAGDVVADCSTAEAIGSEACNMQVAEVSTADGLLVIGGGTLVLLAFAAFLFIAALAMNH